MLPGQSQAGIWALGNIQEENGFVLSLASARSRFRAGNSSGFLPTWPNPREHSSYLRSFWDAQWGRMGWDEGLVGTGPSAAALTAIRDV